MGDGSFVTTGDFNGDGITDFVSYGRQNVVGLGQGAGKFAVQAPFAVDFSFFDGAVGDFNQDGRSDVALTSGDFVRVFFGSPSGALSAPTNLTGTAPEDRFSRIFAGAFRRPARADILSTAAFVAETRLFENRGQGVFDLKVGPTATASDGNGIPGLVGDFNGDGFLDGAQPHAENTAIKALLGNGTALFHESIFATVPILQDYAAGDFNGDGITDIATCSSFVDTGGVQVLLGRKNSKFTLKTDLPLPCASLAAGDFNNNGKLDLVLIDFSGVSTFLAGRGDGTFKAAQPLALSASGNVRLTSIQFGGRQGATGLLVNARVIDRTTGAISSVVTPYTNHCDYKP